MTDNSVVEDDIAIIVSALPGATSFFKHFVAESRLFSRLFSRTSTIPTSIGGSTKVRATASSRHNATRLDRIGTDDTKSLVDLVKNRPQSVDNMRMINIGHGPR